MARTADTGNFEVKRSDLFAVSPHAIVVDWKKNLSRGGQKPPVDDSLKSLARDMIPVAGVDPDEGGSSGQLNPVTVRKLPDGRLELVIGFRRLAAALWLIESGECPDFILKYTVAKMNDFEAAVRNLAENVERSELTPIQLAHAIRRLNEGYSMTIKQIAARLHRSPNWCRNLVELVTLPDHVQKQIHNGEVPVTAAIEATKLAPEHQAEVFDEAATSGEPVTVAKIREKRQKVHEETGKGTAPKHTLKELKDVLEGLSGPAEPGYKLAVYVLDFLDGKKSCDQLANYWGKQFNG